MDRLLPLESTSAGRRRGAGGAWPVTGSKARKIFKYGPSTVTAVGRRLKKVDINSNSSRLVYDQSTIDSFQRLSCEICFLVGCYRSDSFTGVRFLNAASYPDAPVALKPAKTGENEQNIVKNVAKCHCYELNELTGRTTFLFLCYRQIIVSF